MDAVELSCLVDVVVPAKLMGSEGCGGVRVSSNKAESNCERARVSIVANSSIERCSASISKKDEGSSDSSLWRKLIHSHDVVHERLTKLCVENTSEPASSVCKNGFLPNASPESRKAGKLSRSSSGASKRTKPILLEDTMISPRDNDIKYTYGQGSTLSDKPQTVKQRNSYSGRRGEKRNSKVPARTFPTLNTASGENAFFGAYGLKPERNDVAKLVEDLPLEKLLEGSYECPSLGKDKLKKVETANDTFLTLVRNVCSVLPTPRPIQPQNSAELDSCTDKTLGSPNSVSVVANGESSNQGNAPEGELSPSSKDHSVMSEMPSTPLNFPLCEPTDVLRRLGLPPPKDLDSLLQDASKPSQCSKNNSDQRSAKQLPPRVGLPHFPWSHSFNGNCRTNSEAAKLLVSRTLCQGCWLRIANNTSSPRNVTDSFTNLDSFTFNQSLVPSLQKQTTAGNETFHAISDNPSWCKCFRKVSGVSPGPDVSKDEKDDDLRCPRLLAAAQTLYDIAIHSQNRIPRCPKKLSQKSMKARKSKFNEKPEGANGMSPSIDPCSSNNQALKEAGEQPKPSKRQRLSTMENKKGVNSSATGERKQRTSSSKMKNLIQTKTPEKAPASCQQKARRAMGID
ncbi:PREDICTED: uncharacterized protein LOC104817764 isoform X2 [Tarenaya hassleriana]|uniref:uncharacterized protein LOC104817764 isoform X2 n=1 Tax=Tarenaya hassleriana TaxID=28532 RepID=UPI00053C09EE|nr:PREDICTED: uncharacterized protein LOC104817764 isoform X2 [Tarenaya hassleriana]